MELSICCDAPLIEKFACWICSKCRHIVKYKGNINNSDEKD